MRMKKLMENLEEAKRSDLDYPVKIAREYMKKYEDAYKKNKGYDLLRLDKQYKKKIDPHLWEVSHGFTIVMYELMHGLDSISDAFAEAYDEEYEK